LGLDWGEPLEVLPCLFLLLGLGLLALLVFAPWFAGGILGFVERGFEGREFAGIDLGRKPRGTLLELIELILLLLFPGLFHSNRLARVRPIQLVA
jgi:hypothetical protein